MFFAHYGALLLQVLLHENVEEVGDHARLVLRLLGEQPLLFADRLLKKKH